MARRPAQPAVAARLGVVDDVDARVPWTRATSPLDRAGHGEHCLKAGLLSGSVALGLRASFADEDAAGDFIGLSSGGWAQFTHPPVDAIRAKLGRPVLSCGRWYTPGTHQHGNRRTTVGTDGRKGSADAQVIGPMPWRPGLTPAGRKEFESPHPLEGPVSPLVSRYCRCVDGRAHPAAVAQRRGEIPGAAPRQERQLVVVVGVRVVARAQPWGRRVGSG